MGLGVTCNSQGPSLLPSPQAYERQVPPRAVINSAGYKILTSVDQYLELVGNSLPGNGAPIPGRNALHGPRDWAQGEGSPDPRVQAPRLQKDLLGPELRAGAQQQLSPKRGGPRPPSESRLGPSPLLPGACDHSCARGGDLTVSLSSS